MTLNRFLYLYIICIRYELCKRLVTCFKIFKCANELSYIIIKILKPGTSAKEIARFALGEAENPLPFFAKRENCSC